MLNGEALKHLKEAQERPISEVRTISEASLGLLEVMYDLTDTMGVILVSPENLHPLDPVDAGGVETALNIVSSFINDGEFQITARPRGRVKKDKQLYPGDHSGIAVQLAREHTGEIGMINIYGGLRDIKDPQALQDSDAFMRNHHAGRTDHVISQPTLINFHIKKKDRGDTAKPILDFWCQYHFKQQFQLANLFVYSRRVNVMATLRKNDPRFEQISDPFHRHLRTLLSLIPSA